jgi:hypothetical protein
MVVSYSSLPLYEESALGFPLPLWERDRVRGETRRKNMFTQGKAAVSVETDHHTYCIGFLAKSKIAQIRVSHRR